MSEHDPYETPEAKEARQAAEQLARTEAAKLVSDDVVWLASGPKGRRIIRRDFRDAKINLRAADIATSFPQGGNSGQMFFNEGTRARAFTWLGQLLLALATGALPLESWQALVMEID